jgi:NADP-dependent aldehyde dehydrogenase
MTHVAGELYKSCSLGSGPFCTNPGLVVLLQNEAGQAFLESVKSLFVVNPAGILLGGNGPKGIAEGIRVLVEAGAEVVAGGQEVDGPGYSFENTLLRVSGETFLLNPHALQTEVFGTVSLMVFAKDSEQLASIAANLEGNLTGCIYSHTQGEDDEIYRCLDSFFDNQWLFGKRLSEQFFVTGGFYGDPQDNQAGISDIRVPNSGPGQRLQRFQPCLSRRQR